MTPAARLSAAIEIVADIEAQRRPAADVLKDWGLSHRFAGSSDRAAIAGLIYDTLRRKASSAWLIGEASARAAVIGMLRSRARAWRRGNRRIMQRRAVCAGAVDRRRARSADRRSPGAARRPMCGAITRNGSMRSFARVFGDERAAEGAALASRAPLDLRVNTLKAEREEVSPKLAHLHAEPTRWSPLGPAHQAFGGREKPGHPRRARFSQRHGRSAGRSLAACRAVVGRQARRAGCSISPPAPAARRWRWRR